MQATNFGNPGQTFPQQQAPAPVLGGHAAQGADHVEAETIQIVSSSTGTSFFVVGVQKNEPVKSLLKELGGHHNAHMRGYKFAARDIDKVRAALKLDGGQGLIDPRKVIEVEFTQKFQWPGDMEQAEKKLIELGLKKSGRANAWTGDLSRAGPFLAAFNFSAAQPQGK
jgi:hypothetical protein